MARLLGILAVALSAALLVPAFAQDKAPDKKDGDKNPGKTETDKKKVEPPKKKPAPKPLQYGQVFTGKLRSVSEKALEIADPDPKKAAELRQWDYQQQNEIRRTFQNRQQRIAQYKKDLAQKQDAMYADKGKQYRVADGMRIRAATPPIEYDDKGFQKKSTAKKDKYGYPADFDTLHSGQLVMVYLARTKTPPPRTKDKKGLKLDDEEDMRTRPEVVMIVITAEPPKGQ